MTPRGHRLTLLLTAIAWFQAGMRVNRAFAVHDAGGTVESGEWIFIGAMVVWGVLGVVALWQRPSHEPQS